MNIASRTILLLAVVIFAALTGMAHALVYISTGDSTFNTTAPGGTRANSGWQWQGSWGGFLGTPIGPHHFITAAHVGGSTNQMFQLNGVNYQPLETFDDPETDLKIWRISGTFPSYAAVYQATNELGKTLVVFGRGAGRGMDVSVTNSGTVKVQGWQWGANEGRLRWGANVVSSIRAGGTGIGSLLRATFDAAGGTYEAHMAGGDSGGAVFIQESGTWKLAGINFAVDGRFNHTDSGAGFDGALFDSGGLFVGSQAYWHFTTNQSTDIPSGFYATRISQRITWITCVLNQSACTDATVQLTSVRQVGTDLAIEFNTIAGCRYQLERSDQLEGNSWINQGSRITGTGNTMTVIDAKASGATGRFYRIRTVDCATN